MFTKEKNIENAMCWFVHRDVDAVIIMYSLFIPISGGYIICILFINYMYNAEDYICKDEDDKETDERRWDWWQLVKQCRVSLARYMIPVIDSSLHKNANLVHVLPVKYTVDRKGGNGRWC